MSAEEKQFYTFFLNWMGPVSMKWYEENNIPYTEETRYSYLLQKEVHLKHYSEQYCIGRIDISGNEEEYPYGLEYGVPMMNAKSWGLLSDWLSELRLPKLPSSKELFEMFEEQTGHKIKWFEYK